MKGFKKALLVVGLTVSTTLSAATVTMYGDDISFTFDNASLFGMGNVVGNSIFFEPTNFIAQSANGAGAVPANETLNIHVVVTTMGYDISSLAMYEEGDYIVNGVDASVSASGRLGVVSGTTLCGAIVCKDSSIFNVAGLGNTAGMTVGWTGSTNVDLANTMGWGSDTDLHISFQNKLTANTLNTGEEAFIQKKFGAIGLIVNPVPVPAAVWLFGSGLLGLVAVARRKQS